FSISNWRDCGFPVHECTHALLDIQNLGDNDAHENEAAAYLAEAVYLESDGDPPLGVEQIRVVAHRIAKLILSGTYQVPESDANDLVHEVAIHPHYKTTTVYHSNGFNRSLIHRILR